MNIQHSSRSDQWHTPDGILALVHDVLGGIDFDPASSAAANLRVKATQFLTAQDDALVAPWDCENKSVYLNPPGGKTGNKSNLVLYWQKLMSYRGQFNHAIFLSFSLGALQTTQKPGFPAIGEFPLCIPSKRIRFLRPDGKPGPAPSHPNALVYVPGVCNHTQYFGDVFGTLGTCIYGKAVV